MDSKKDRQSAVLVGKIRVFNYAFLRMRKGEKYSFLVVKRVLRRTEQPLRGQRLSFSGPTAACSAQIAGSFRFQVRDPLAQGVQRGLRTIRQVQLV